MGDATKARSKNESLHEMIERVAEDAPFDEEVLEHLFGEILCVVNAQSEEEALQRLDELQKETSPRYLKKSFETARGLVGGTPLAAVCSRGWPEVANWMIQVGADPNEANHHGDTSLHSACRCCKEGSVACVKLLIGTGNVNVNAVGIEGQTPLHNVKLETEKARLLVEAGADVMALDNDGATPLHYVDIPETASFLLQAGADISFKNKDGETPLHHCLVMRSCAAISLIENGADLTALAPSFKMETMMTPVDFMADTLSQFSSDELFECVHFLTKVLPVMVEYSTTELREAHPNVLNVALVGGQMLQRVANEFTGQFREETGEYDEIMDFVGPLLDMGADINYAGKPMKRFELGGCEIPFKGGIEYTPLHCLLSPNREDEFFEDCEDHKHGLDGYVCDMVDEIHKAVRSCGQKINYHAKSADGTTLLHMAVPAYPRTLERLVELAGQQDPEPDSTSIEKSPTQGQLSFIDACMGDERTTALHVAAMKEEDGTEGLPSSVGTLLRLGADPHTTTADTNSTALHLACQYGNSAAVVTSLLQHESNGAGLWNAVDSSGKSALHHAVGRSDSSSLSLKLVLPFMAQIAKKHDKKDDVDGYEQLKVDVLDEKKQTPLHVLCCVGKEMKDLHKLVTWLLDNACNAETSHMSDQYGMTPLAWMATQNPHNLETLTSMFALLKQQAPVLSAHRIRASRCDGARHKGSSKKRRTNN